MMNFDNIGSNSRISHKIYFGFGLLISALFIVAIINYFSHSHGLKRFDEIDQINEKSKNILIFDKGILHLQHMLENYINTGSRSLEEDLEFKETQIRKGLIELEEQFNDKKMLYTIDKMKIQLQYFNKSFVQVKQEVKLKYKFMNTELQSMLEEINQYIADAKKSSSIKHLYLKYENKLVNFQKAFYQYLSDPNLPKFNKSLESYNQSLKPFNNYTSFQRHQEFLNLAQVFAKKSFRVVLATRSFMYLYNVVMTANIEELRYQSEQLRSSVLKQAPIVTRNVKHNAQKANLLILGTSLFFVLLGFIFSYVIIQNISGPIDDITIAFRNLSRGDVNAEIPKFENRNDEIAELSVVANIYKNKILETLGLLEELESNKLKLEKTNEELQQFSYRTSHDLKAPLMTIRNLSQLITEDIDEKEYEEAKSNLARIESLSKELETLVDDILSLTKLDYLHERSRKVELKKSIQKVHEKFSYLIELNDVKINVDRRSLELIYVQPTRFQSILENLISNAIKYSDPNKDFKWIDVKLVIHNQNYLLSVKDNGLGIPEKHQEKVFSMFGRVHSQVAFGSGLGLYSIKKQLELHGGKIWFESLHEGVAFHCEFPVKDADDEQEGKDIA